MNKTLLASIALSFSFLSPSVFAADAPLPYKAAPAAVVQYPWTACFIGGNGGYGSSRIEIDSAATLAFGPAVPLHRHTAKGGVAGGQFGCDVQADRWVVGAEVKGDWANLHGSSTIIPNPAASRESTIRGLVTISARTGWLAQPNLLLYYRSGAAFLFMRDRLICCIDTQSARMMRAGLLAGAGFEYAVAGNWSVFAEYNYVYIPQGTVHWQSAIGGPFDLRYRQNLHLGLVGINYRFGLPAVAARY